LVYEIPSNLREKVLEIVTDMSPSMESIVRIAFPNAILTTDRFHVMKMLLDDLNAIRIRAKTALKKKEGDTIKQAKVDKKKYIIERFANGETEVEIVTRLKRQMCKRIRDWNNNQKNRWLIAQTINELDELVIGYELI
jgi:transposase